jgi:hypothetical protein
MATACNTLMEDIVSGLSASPTQTSNLTIHPFPCFQFNSFLFLIPFAYFMWFFLRVTWGVECEVPGYWVGWGENVIMGEAGYL